MKRTFAVIKREYIQIVRTKGFIIGTVLGPVLMAAMILIPIFVSVVAVDKQEIIGVVDMSREVFTDLEKKLDHQLKDGSRKYVLEEYRAGEDLEKTRESLNQEVMEERLTAYILIPEDIFNGGTAEYASQHVADFDKTRRISEALNRVVIEKRLKREGLDPEKIAEYLRRPSFKTVKVTKRGAEEDTGGTFIISYILVLILYMSLFIYGAIIMRGVIEEKNSRVVEIVLSSLKPFQLMTGKILGIAAVGFTQYAIWSLFGIVLTQYGKSMMLGFFPEAAGFKMPTIPTYIFIYFIVFFILGYFLFATLYAAIGSLVNSEKEAQQLMWPINMSLILPILLIMFIMRSPNSGLSVVLSLIPFFAPILMLLRVCVLLPPFIQVAGSIVLLVLTTVFLIWLTAKIYRTGILMYGKPPSFKEIIKWVRYS